jgi:cob(I)alamin adenosyltransferase
MTTLSTDSIPTVAIPESGNAPDVPAELEQTVADKGLSDEQHRRKMEQRQAVQAKRIAEKNLEKGLIIVNTGNGKGKTTAALGMVLRSLGHGYRVAIVQFIKGAWEPAEKAAFAHWSVAQGDQPPQLEFCAMGEGFTWNTQDRARDIAKAEAAWETSLAYILDPAVKLVLLDEVNIALKMGYLEVETILAGLDQKPADCHVILTGRGAPAPLIERADLVTEMTLLKHPFREQGVKAQPGIEF